jgi:hypothetical protein
VSGRRDEYSGDTGGHCCEGNEKALRILGMGISFFARPVRAAAPSRTVGATPV